MGPWGWAKKLWWVRKGREVGKGGPGMSTSAQRWGWLLCEGQGRDGVQKERSRDISFWGMAGTVVPRDRGREGAWHGLTELRRAGVPALWWWQGK